MAGLRRRGWWDTVAFPVQRICNRLTVCLGIRKTGLLKLQRDVRSCEYEDIRIMWDLLHKHEEVVRSPRTKKKTCWNIYGWGRRAPYLCRSF